MFQSIRDTFPKNNAMRFIILGIVFAILFAPFLFEGTRALDTAARLCIFIVLVASYDILLGYTGVVSFAHTLFFGIGAYAVALTFVTWTPGFGTLILALGIAIAVSVVIALIMGFVSLRVKTIFYAMITLAVASVAMVLVSQLYQVTGGEDGLTFRLPRELTPAFRLLEEPLFGVRINGRILNYYLIVSVSVVCFMLMIRLVASPFGKVLKAIRENEFRAEAIGYETVYYRTLATVFSSAMASVAGVLMALWLRYTGPDSVLHLNIMIDVLLMVVIGGMGTLYGAIIGATIMLLARNYLFEVMQAGQNLVTDVPILFNLLSPDRWLLWLGILFIVMVYFFPMGIIGRFNKLKGV